MANSMRYTPTYNSLRREIDRVFDQMTNPEQSEGERSAVWAPRADLSETQDAYIIRMDTPGMAKENIDIQVHEGVLSVTGDRKAEHVESRENYHRVERSYGRFYRSFTLPQASAGDNVKASLKDGVLTIEVPKREESKPRKIEIS